jgi:hypothetical protein
VLVRRGVYWISPPSGGFGETRKGESHQDALTGLESW